MTLRPEFTLGHSPSMLRRGRREQAGVPLTVLSALTRLGFDPWQEAARLSDLPRDTAARAFAVTIAMLPEGDWKAEDSEAIATRLVNWLPEHSAKAVPSVRAGPPVETKDVGGRKMRPELVKTLAWGVLIAALLYFAVSYFSTNNLEAPARARRFRRVSHRSNRAPGTTIAPDGERARTSGASPTPRIRRAFDAAAIGADSTAQESPLHVTVSQQLLAAAGQHHRTLLDDVAAMGDAQGLVRFCSTSSTLMPVLC